ncbi:MAG: hypothetical protein JWO59_2727 [Chloroflexi bacterium]|nr:hypothetical protein [Chloroflexota bacterium]
MLVDALLPVHRPVVAPCATGRDRAEVAVSWYHYVM